LCGDFEQVVLLDVACCVGCVELLKMAVSVELLKMAVGVELLKSGRW